MTARKSKKTGYDKEVMERMKEQYGEEKGKEVYYATANEENRDPETFEKKSSDVLVEVLRRNRR